MTRSPQTRPRLRGALLGALSVTLLGTALTPSAVQAHDEHGASGGTAGSEATYEMKNALSRAGVLDETAYDPTSPEDSRRARAAAAAMRREPTPQLRTVPLREKRTARPQTRYAMAGGCYVLRSVANGRWVRQRGDAYAADRPRRGQASPLRFQATDLGQYLLFTADRDFLAADGARVRVQDRPAPTADFTVRKKGRAFTFTSARGRSLGTRGTGVVAGSRPGRFTLHRAIGCARFPEAQVNVSGRPFAGETSFQQVTGLTDAHTHGMAYEFLGGEAHCGRPWHPYGVTYALVDCEDHTLTGGYGAALELLLSGEPHDPVGWPTFEDWPAPNSLTHEGTYYKWMERAWRGGLRVFTNLLVENNQLCMLYPLKRNSCDDMDSVRLQARRMYEFERYIDAQWGGPGKGWYRIVKNPFQARRVINAGKLAVIMGIETSIPFDCTVKLGVPQCSRDDIDDGLAEVRRMGVRQMELVNKFDNALSGVAGDAAETGVAVNAANFLETGSFWAMRRCEDEAAAEAGVTDREQAALPAAPQGELAQQQDALFGAVAAVTGALQPVPLYPPGPHCNARGLTPLGDHLIRELADRRMLFDPDHMSVAARKEALDLIERLDYPGILSSHSWSTPDAYPRILEMGGFISPYAGDSAGFVDKWRAHLDWVDERYLFGLGYGADINGLGAQGDPRGADAPNPVTYPFTALGGSTVRKQRSGKRVYDINVDGVAHYGLYPDWIEDLRRQAGGDIVADMARGAEAYLQTWERAVGVSPDACRDDSVRKPVRVLDGLRRGTRVEAVLRRAGQPHTRLGSAFGYCARDAAGRTVERTVTFDRRGRVTGVRRA
ncbi:hypothetical protein KLP28_05690 [Nocardioidaceae bacterium]|nr:hypothetical protein KLP28_05690 [Nocardioidaceae bacterium]